MCRDISMSEFYKPLNEGLTIKESGIHGIGIFATNDIPKGTRLGLSHMLVDTEIFRTPLGGFYNHSMSPNTKKTQEGHKWFLDVIEDIKIGDEILVTYTLYKVEHINKLSIISQFMQED